MDVFGTLYRLNIVPFLKNWKLVNLILGAMDICAIAFAFQCSYLINFDDGGFFFFQPRLVKLFFLIMPFWLFILYLIQITEIPRTKPFKVLFFEYLQSTILILVLLMVFYFVFKLYLISRLFLIQFAFFGFIFLFMLRVWEYKVFRTFRSKGFNFVNIVLMADDTSIPFIESLLSNKEWGYRLVAIFTGSEVLRKKYESSLIILPEEYLRVLNDLMEVDLIDEVLYIRKKIVTSEVRETIRSCEELGVTFRLKSPDKIFNLTNAVKTELANETFLTFINVPHNSFALVIKKIMDISISLSIIIVLLPVFIVIASIVKLTSSGPVIFKQARVGLRGRQFNLFKFRSMVVNAEDIRKDLGDKNEMDGPVFKIKNDPRVTKIGKFLRKTGLDELPQLFNVLRGEMSLIGPRPPLQSETLQYKRWQLRRLSVKPGLSCFWQVKPGRNNIKFDKWMELDLAYIDNWSIRLDLIILIKTIGTVFKRNGV
jgi:exopolysaccharide biosynthesis polyprenyl glycosylphosphotransferase